jgi:hypothetical protein
MAILMKRSMSEVLQPLQRKRNQFSKISPRRRRWRRWSLMKR